MSETMLHGVLNIPLSMWTDTALFKVQQHARCVEASKLIYELQAEVERLKSGEPIYKCPNCEAIYQEKVSQCDCHFGKQEWVEGYAIFPEA